MKRLANELTILGRVNSIGLLISNLLLNIFRRDGFQKDPIVSMDSSRIDRKHFSENLSDRYTGSQYEYDAVEGETENLFNRALNWFYKKLNDLFGLDLSPGWQQTLETVIYAILIAVVIHMLVKFLVGNRATSIFSKESRSVAPLDIQEEHIKNVDLDAYIANALKEENYRLAIRYMYLKSLKLLSINNLIEWHFEKTNTDYFNEIENGEIKSHFRNVSYWYDHIWYGQFALDKKGFENAQKDFQQLNKTLKHAG